MRTQTLLAVAGIAAALCLGASESMAQQNNGGGGGGGRGRRGNMDFAQRQQMMMDQVKAELEVTNEDEWKVMQPLVQKVMDVRRAQFAGMGRGMFGGGRGGRGGPGGDQGGPGGGMRPPQFGQADPDAEALQKAIDAKATKAEMKAALSKFVESRKAKETQLKAAQEDLRKVLTTRQEAIATLNGLL